MFGFKKIKEEIYELNSEIKRIKKVEKLTGEKLKQHEKYINRLSSVLHLFEKQFRESIVKDGVILYMTQSLNHYEGHYGYKFQLKYNPVRDVFELNSVDDNRNAKKQYTEQFITLVALMDNIKNDVWYVEEIVQTPTVCVEKEVKEEIKEVTGKIAVAHMLKGGKFNWDGWIYFLNSYNKIVYKRPNGYEIKSGFNLDELANKGMLRNAFLITE